ncbi:hypothetical protein [Mycolicibacterium porcinum]
MTARNTWLRSMDVRLTWTGKALGVHFGGVSKMAEELNAGGLLAIVKGYVTRLHANGIREVEIEGDQVVFVFPDGSRSDPIDLTRA